MGLGRRTARVAGLLAAGLLLAACSTGGGPDPATSGSSALEPTGWRSVDRDQVGDGGTLTLPVDALPANYLLYHPTSGYYDDLVISTLFVPAFVRTGTDGSWSADPDYVDSLTVTSEDPLTVELKIAPDAVWSDGTPMTYQDVRANWTALAGTDPAYTLLPNPVWADVASVERGSDDRDVVVTFTHPNAEWPAVFGGIYPAWLLDTPEHADTAWTTGPMTADGSAYVSGGPFVVTGVDPDAQVLTFGRNPRWWGDEPKLDTVVFRAVSRTSQGQAFANGEIDLVDAHGDADVLASAEQRDDATIERSLSTTLRAMVLNGTDGPFADQAVRKAFAVALDRSVLAESVVGAVGAPVQLAGGLVFLPGQRGYVDHLGGVLTGNPDDARQILTDDGWAIGDDGVATKDGEPLTVRFVVPSETPVSSNVAELVRQQTAAAGFDVQVQTVPEQDYFTSYASVDSRNFDVTYYGQSGSSWPIANAKAYFGPDDLSLNLGGVSDPALTDLFARAGSEFDDDARIALGNQADEVITTLFTTIPLFVEPWTWGVRADLANYGPSQFESPRWQDVGFTG